METTTQAPPAEAVNRDGLWPMPPGPPHEERHFTQVEVVRDLVAGAAEGPVLPFAVATALAGSAAGRPAILVAGLAALAAGALAASVGRMLAARDEAAHYADERRREEEETVEYEDRERWEVAAILHRYGVRGDALRLAVDSICADKTRWVDFMMRFELDLKEPDPRRALRAALGGGVGHAAAGLLPLLPWMLPVGGLAAALGSAVLAAAALGGFGWLKARGAGLPPARGAALGLVLGGVAAAGAVLVARMAGG